MNFCSILLSIILCVCVVHGQEDSDCNTRAGMDGQCISLNDCDKLKPLIKKSAADREYLKQRHCGFDKDIPKVCCPPVTKAQQRCITEKDTVGVCVVLEACPKLANLLLKKPVKKETYERVQRSRCDGSSSFDVCCERDDNTELLPNSLNLLLKTSNKEENNNQFFTEKPMDKKSKSDDIVQYTCTSTTTLPDPKTECCGVHSISGHKITGGVESPIDAYPWLAIIEYSLPNLCGGSLISGKYVITAAHCIVGSTNKPRGAESVLLGEHNIANPGPDCLEVDDKSVKCTNGSISIPIESTIVHPEYNSLKNVFQANDIALIRLREMAPYTEFIRPICLPENDITATTPSNLRLYVAGWGAVSEKNRRSDVKVHVDLPFVDYRSCTQKYSITRKSILWDKQLCAGGEKKKDSCKGDSGGPLSVAKLNHQELIGIISFGILQCGRHGNPSVYTKVYEYVPWIRDNITPE